MREYLKHYKMRITAQSPIHVGDGRKIGKTEYIQLGQKSPVIIPDITKMLSSLMRLGKIKEYEKYILSDRTIWLGQWLYDQKIPQSEIDSWKCYAMDPGDAFVRENRERNNVTPKEIMSFVKDPCNQPYIPGSTLKGMLRTAILCQRVEKNPSLYKKELNDLVGKATPQHVNNVRGTNKKFLKKETEQLEKAVFNTLERENKKQLSSENFIMSGLIVSDSDPIPVSQLILARKIDYTLSKEEKKLPILREAVKPGTQIYFDITIDTNTCDVSIEEIMEALDYFKTVSYDYFYRYFDRGSNEKGTVWIGGGTGFLSKTVLYPLFKGNALQMTDAVFNNSLGYNYIRHHHDKDLSKRIAPHVCKCTRYNGKLYDMGMGKIEIVG